MSLLTTVLTQLYKTKPEVFMASFSQGTSMVLVPVSTSKSFHPRTCAYTPRPHMAHRLEMSEGPWHHHMALPMSPRTAIAVTSCKWQVPGPVSPSGAPKGSLLDNLTSQRRGRSHEETCSSLSPREPYFPSPPPRHPCRGKESCNVNY